MAPKRGQAKKEEQVVQLGPQVGAGDKVFCTAHIYASFNDTFVHVTDLSGKYESSFIISLSISLSIKFIGFYFAILKHRYKHRSNIREIFINKFSVYKFEGLKERFYLLINYINTFLFVIYIHFQVIYK